MLFLSSPSRCDVFIFMVSAHLDEGVESISEFGIPKIQILLPPPSDRVVGWLAEEMYSSKWALGGGLLFFVFPKFNLW